MTQNRLLTRVFLALLVFAFVTTSFTTFSQDPAPEEAAVEAEGDIPTDPARISEGQSIFDANCKTCHRVHQKLVGPALANVYDRAPSIDWIVNFINNSAKVIRIFIT